MPVGYIVLKEVRAGRPRRLRDAGLAAGKAAAVGVIVAGALQAAVDGIRPHPRGADEVDVNHPAGRCIARVMIESRRRNPVQGCCCIQLTLCVESLRRSQ